MRRYMTTLLILSVFHLALAAPVNIGEMLEVRSNAVDAPKGGVAAWEKRMDDDNDLTTPLLEHHDDLDDEPEDDSDSGGEYEGLVDGFLKKLGRRSLPRKYGSGMGTALQGTGDTKANVSDSPSSNKPSCKYSNPQFNG